MSDSVVGVRFPRAPLARLSDELETVDAGAPHSFIIRPSRNDCGHASLPCAPYTGNITKMSSARRIAWMVGTWIFILVIYSAVSLSLKRDSESLSAFGDLVQCVVPLLANAGLLLNAGISLWRRHIFRMLLALSCTRWMIGLVEWTW